MSDYFNCEVCDKFIKIEPKKKHLISQYHKSLSMSVIIRNTVKNPDFLYIEKLLKNYILDCSKKFAFYSIICKWKLQFSDMSINVKSNTRRSFFDGFFQEFSYYQKFNTLSDMDITFLDIDLK